MATYTILLTILTFGVSLLPIATTAPLIPPYYSRRLGRPMKRLQVHGSWCGISHETHKGTADPCVDELDCLCRMHRNCLNEHENRDGFHCHCNSEMLAQISELDQQMYPAIPVLMPQFQFCIVKRKATKFCRDGHNSFSFLPLLRCVTCVYELIQTPDNAPVDTCFANDV